MGQIQPAFLSVNKISLAPEHALSMATMTEVSSCYRERMAHKTENIYYRAFIEKGRQLPHC